MDRLPWIPTDAQWRAVLEVAASESLRNRLMFALAYDAALRREELCLLATDDLDPAHRTLAGQGGDDQDASWPRRAVFGGGRGVVGAAICGTGARITAARGALFVSESPRNRAQPITPWTWSKVVRSIAVRAGVAVVQHAHVAAPVSDGSRPVGLGDRIRSRRSPGIRSTDTTQRYIHLSGRDLAARLESGMTQIHTERIAQIAEALA